MDTVDGTPNGRRSPVDSVDGTLRLGAGIGDLRRFCRPNGRRNPVDSVDGTPNGLRNPVDTVDGTTGQRASQLALLPC